MTVLPFFFLEGEFCERKGDEDDGELKEEGPWSLPDSACLMNLMQENEC